MYTRGTKIIYVNVFKVCYRMRLWPHARGSRLPVGASAEWAKHILWNGKNIYTLFFHNCFMIK